jgi:hypothetical protein
MTIYKNSSTTILTHFKIKSPTPEKGNPYWMDIDLSYLDISSQLQSPMPKYNFLLVKSSNYTQFLLKFYKDFSYEIRSFSYHVDGLVGPLL